MGVRVLVKDGSSIGFEVSCVCVVEENLKVKGRARCLGVEVV